MIYHLPETSNPLDQGDLIDGCPVVFVQAIRGENTLTVETSGGFQRVLILSQTCDLANEKLTSANVAEVIDADELVHQQVLKAADIKGPLRSGRIWGLYFLPAFPDLGLKEMIVDFRRLHTVRLDILRTLCQAGKRRARLQTPYREHLAKHFADTFSRIGLPQPYETF